MPLPQIGRARGEIRRVLQPVGQLYVSVKVCYPHLPLLDETPLQK